MTRHLGEDTEADFPAAPENATKKLEGWQKFVLVCVTAVSSLAGLGWSANSFYGSKADTKSVAEIRADLSTVQADERVHEARLSNTEQSTHWLEQVVFQIAIANGVHPPPIPVPSPIPSPIATPHPAPTAP
jgi:hypothetical protein